jgi:hypothetical protein
MPRRSVEAILAAHEMDPARRELFVEGSHDRSFLVWLAGAGMADESLVHDIDQVDLPDVQGGNRERVLTLARRLAGHAATIRCLVDADGSHVNQGETIPGNVWLTDLCDAEWYVLSRECMDRALALGVRRSDVSGQALLANAIAFGLDAAAIRYASRALGLDLPVSGIQLHKFMRMDAPFVFVLESSTLIRALLQRKGISLAQLDTVTDAFVRERSRLDGIRAELVVRGRDAMAVVAEAFMRLCGIRREDGPRLLWTSFDRAAVPEFPILEAVLTFLTAKRGQNVLQAP